MTEEDVFQAALAKSDPAERRALLDEACGGDAVLRQRVEALLRSHEEARSFLNVPALEQGARPAQPEAAPTDQTAAEAAVGADEALAFLSPSQKPGTLGRLAHYEIQVVIGRGGMGVVLKAFDEKLHRVVAVKVLAPQLASSGAARQRFLREARSAAAVVHEHVVTIHAVDEADGVPYLVMECVAGQSLQEKLDREGPLPLKETLRIAVQAAEGLAAAHKRGLVHRDVKPANILLENGVERVKLTDFGLARAIDDASLTQSGVIAGTPMFMSPEQAAGERLDHRSDLFSLGSVLYAMCTGRAPFRASSTMAVLKRVCEEAPQPVREINPETPEWLADVIAKLHAKKPEDRYPSAQAVTDLLGARLAELQASGRALPAVAAAAAPPKPAPRWRSWKAAALVGLLLLGAIGATVALWPPRGQGPAPTPPGDNKGDKNPPVVVVDPKAPFVVLARDDRAEQPFPTLKDAVEKAQSGDAIEIRGDGPFATPSILIDHKALTLRAGPGCRPVLTTENQATSPNILSTNAPLVLEGLEFQSLSGAAKDPAFSLIWTIGAPLHVAHCRIVAVGLCNCIDTQRCPRLDVRDTQFLSSSNGWSAISLGDPAPRSRHVVDNCVYAGCSFLCFGVNASPDDVDIALTANMVAARQAIEMIFQKNFLDAEAASPSVRLRLTANAIRAEWRVLDIWAANVASSPHPDEYVAWVRKHVLWVPSHNLVHAPNEYLGAYEVPARDPERVHVQKAEQEWRAFWRLDSDDTLGDAPLFGRPGLLDRIRSDLPSLSPADFRLADGSPGKGKGEGGKDLGADVDKVGPGQPYEEWKKTPEYEEWRKQTDQMMAAPPG